MAVNTTRTLYQGITKICLNNFCGDWQNNINAELCDFFEIGKGYITLKNNNVAQCAITGIL